MSFTLSAADTAEIIAILIGSWGLGLAFGVKIQSVVHFFKISS